MNKDGDADQVRVAQDLARDLVVEFAPEEADLFDELAAAAGHSSTHRRDDPLAFGAGELVAALTPTALAVAKTALGYRSPVDYEEQHSPVQAVP